MRRVAVVTGAAAGIGAATCDLLEVGGWEVVPVDCKPMARQHAITVDLEDDEATSAALGRLPRVDGLVNNAAVQLFKPIADTDLPEWDRVAAVNLRGPVACLQAVRRQLERTRGAVVNVASVHAHATSPGAAAYAASKAGLLSFTRSAAIELGPSGVRVNAVTPGAIDTQALRAGLDRASGSMSSLISRTPLGRIGRPLDIAHAIAFLLDSDRSAFMTGQQIVVDGGAMARLSTE